MIYGLVLAGGRSRRFGREKALAEVGGRSLIDRVAAVLANGCDRVAINAGTGSGAAAFARTRRLPVIGDADDDHDGPLAGVKAGLAWARTAGADRLVTAPCDTPFLPLDLVSRLAQAMGDRHAAVARTEDGLQPVCAIWRTDAAWIVAQALGEDRHPPIQQVLARLNAVEAVFDAQAFANINTPQDHQRAEARGKNDQGQITRNSSSTTTITTTRPRPPDG